MLAYAMSVCVLFVSSWSGIVFNPSAGAITYHSQSAKDIDPYFNFQLYVELYVDDFVIVQGLLLRRTKYK